MIKLVCFRTGGPVYVNPAHVSMIRREKHYVRPNEQEFVTVVHVMASCGNVLQSMDDVWVCGTVEEVAALFPKTPKPKA